jgi:DNA-binding NarL/FixJ family response regulator
MLGDESALSSVREALRGGCSAYLRKNANNMDMFRDAIEKLRMGHIYLDAELARQMVLQDHWREAATEEGPLKRLTERERAVFKLIGAGYTNRTAAEHIHLSPKTVEKHRAAVMQKLQLRNAFELRLLAQSLGEGKAEVANR